MESTAANGKITFANLRTRLISLVNARIQNGHFTERGLARMLGISQPQMHNVLKGARTLRPELADRLVATLEITVADLFETAELREQLASRSAQSNEQLDTWSTTSPPLKWQEWKPRSGRKKPPRREAMISRSNTRQAS